MQSRNQKGQDPRCPTCHTPSMKTVRGRATAAVQEARGAAEEVKQQAAMRQAAMRQQQQQAAMRPAVRPGMAGPGAPSPQQPQGPAQGARQPMDPRQLMAMIAAAAQQRGGR